MSPQDFDPKCACVNGQGEALGFLKVDIDQETQFDGTPYDVIIECEDGSQIQFVYTFSDDLTKITWTADKPGVYYISVKTGRNQTTRDYTPPAGSDDVPLSGPPGPNGQLQQISNISICADCDPGVNFNTNSELAADFTDTIQWCLTLPGSCVEAERGQDATVNWELRVLSVWRPDEDRAVDQVEGSITVQNTSTSRPLTVLSIAPPAGEEALWQISPQDGAPPFTIAAGATTEILISADAAEYAAFVAAYPYPGSKTSIFTLELEQGDYTETVEVEVQWFWNQNVQGAVANVESAVLGITGQFQSSSPPLDGQGYPQVNETLESSTVVSGANRACEIVQVNVLASLGVVDSDQQISVDQIAAVLYPCPESDCTYF